MKRKDFLKSAGVLAASTLLFKTEAFANQDAPLRIGLIGANGMGWSNLNAILKINNVTCTALCDVDENVLNKRAAELEQKNKIGRAHV